MMQRRRTRRVLWETSEAVAASNNIHALNYQPNGDSTPSIILENSTTGATTTTYQAVYQQYSTKPTPKPLFELVSNSLVIVQEFSLTCYLLARHRIAFLEDTKNTDAASASSLQFFRQHADCLDRSNYAILGALFLAVAYSSRAYDPSKQQSRQSKARQRSIDALLLGVLLRFLASVLRSLTASYSSDTVQTLALLGMLLHLLTCDYTYANGSIKVATNAATPIAGDDDNGFTLSHQQRRPAFYGGTVALTSALFSTTLLVSRLDSNLSAYFFISLAIILFAFYSGTRHAISSSFPPASSPAVWMITACTVYSAVQLVLDDPALVTLLLGVSLALGLILPAWKWQFQKAKILLAGPWDIPNVATMQLDFRIIVQPEPTSGLSG